AQTPGNPAPACGLPRQRVRPRPVVELLLRDESIRHRVERDLTVAYALPRRFRRHVELEDHSKLVAQQKWPFDRSAMDLMRGGPFGALLDDGLFSSGFVAARFANLGLHADNVIVVKLLHHIEIL